MSSNPMSLSGKRVLVTGASSGIGRASALLAANLGASLVLTGRRVDALEDLRRSLPNPKTHSVIAGNLSSDEFLSELPSRVLADGALDGFVHSAGECRVVPVGLTDQELLEESVKVGYFAFMRLMASFSKKGAFNPGFSSVALSSVSARAGWAGGSLYSGDKAALSAAVRSLAVELAPKGIRVNAVSPSNIRTPMFAAVGGAFKGEEGRAALMARQPLGLGEPEQVASAVCFLLSSAASFVTGVDLPVDGGFLAQ